MLLKTEASSGGDGSKNKTIGHHPHHVIASFMIQLIISFILIVVCFPQKINSIPSPSPLTSQSSSPCICDVRFAGEYCGTVLNKKNPTNNCSKNMYFCGKSNLKQQAIVLKLCNQKSFECEQKIDGGSRCFQNFRCRCTANLSRKGKYCGSALEGQDCHSNIIYRCPMIRRYNASPEDACIGSCLDGKCIENTTATTT